MPGPGDLQLRTEPVHVISAAYTASPQDYVPVDTSSTAVTVTLPRLPQEGTTVRVALVNGGNPVTIACQQPDWLLRYEGQTTYVLSVAGESVTLEYVGGVWHVTAAGAPVSETDSRYKNLSFALANNTYEHVLQWTVTGQTDSPLPSFGVIAGSQTYSFGAESTQGPAFWFGYNPDRLSGFATNGHGAIGISCFGDAGDTYNPATGGHGMEFNLWYYGPTSAASYGLLFGAVDDDTNSTTLSLRCGDGKYQDVNSTWHYSLISMSDSAGNSYWTAGPYNNVAWGAVAANTTPGIIIGAPLAINSAPYFFLSSGSSNPLSVQFTAQGPNGSGALTWLVTSNADAMTATFSAGGGAATFYVSGSTSSALLSKATSGVAAVRSLSADNFAYVSIEGSATVANSGVLYYKRGGTITWTIQDATSATQWEILNNAGNQQLVLTSGANTAGNYDNALSAFLSKVQVYGSLVVSNAGQALAVGATTGFLYIPQVAGQPTGIPVSNAGSSALCFDTTNDKLWVYTSTGWKGVAVA